MNPLLINLLLAVGGSLGEDFIKNPALQGVVATAVTATQNLISILSGNKQNVAVPVFSTVLQAAFAVLQSEGKLTAVQAAALNKAISDTLAADAAAQQTVDPSTIATPVPTLP